MEEIKEENRDELVDILDSFFDPEKDAITPAVKKSLRVRRRSYKGGKENRGDGDKNNERQSSTPDSTTRSPRKARRTRRRFNARRRLSTDEKKEEVQHEQPVAQTVQTEVAVCGD